MTEQSENPALQGLRSRFLCTAEFEVAGGVFSIGQSPFGEQRIGYVTGGRFFGPRLSGRILPGGGNWSRGGRIAAGAVGTFDARSVWQADDGALIHLTYPGRTLIPDDVRAEFADPAAPPVDPARYYLRIAPTFETASPDLAWLNAVLAVGVGERTDFGVRHQLYEVL